MTNQNELMALYQRFLDPKNAAADMISELSAPFLIRTNEQYENAKPKVVVVGQETNGWLGTYRDFLAESKTIECARTKQCATSAFDVYEWILENHKTTFFQYLDMIRFGLYGKASAHSTRKTILWLNLFKISRGPMWRSPWKREVMRLQGDVVQREITLLKPDVVIFLTGPNYDDVLEDAAWNAQITEMGVYPKRQLAQVIQKELLPGLSFRTYHPKYLRLKKKGLEFCIPAIVQAINEAFGRQTPQA
jgi:hypothetical protein